MNQITLLSLNFLSKHPELGFISSILTATFSTDLVLKNVGLVLSTLIAILTLGIKLIEFYDKVKSKRKGK